MTEWTKIEKGVTWDFEKNATFVGLFLSKQENIGPNKSNLYDFEQPGGKIVSVWGSEILDTRIKNIKVGEEVMIKYVGQKTSEKTHRSYKDYEVFHRVPEHKSTQETVKSAGVDAANDFDFDLDGETPKL